MRTHAVFLCLEGRPCVVVGGDAVAEGKVTACVRAGAAVTVIACDATPTVAALAASGAVRHHARAYADGDLAGAVLAYAATRDADLIARLRAEAARERVLLNVVDVPDACDFIAPAVVERGELQVAVGTGGASPALAARLRRELAERVGPEYGELLAILAAVRRTLPPGGERARVVGALLDSPLLELLRRDDGPAVDGLLAALVGEGTTRVGLGLGRAA